mmetsp:Transcript_26077/g.64425  ORF Transcript_26077/g.64425 Transcript_26077/m.64425 type:complete len:259 (-) Transcript_26077:119-895(-)
MPHVRLWAAGVVQGGGELHVPAGLLRAVRGAVLCVCAGSLQACAGGLGVHRVPTELGYLRPGGRRASGGVRMQGWLRGGKWGALCGNEGRHIQDCSRGICRLCSAVPRELGDVVPCGAVKPARLLVQAWLWGAEWRSMCRVPDQYVEVELGQGAVRPPVPTAFAHVRLPGARGQHGLCVAVAVCVRQRLLRDEVRGGLASGPGQQDVHPVRHLASGAHEPCASRRSEAQGPLCHQRSRSARRARPLSLLAVLSLDAVA